MGCGHSNPVNSNSIVPSVTNKSVASSALSSSNPKAVPLSVDNFKLTIPIINDVDLLLEHFASEWQYCTTIEETISHEELVELAKKSLQPIFEKIETNYKTQHPELTDPKKVEKGIDNECKTFFNKKSKKQVVEHVVEAMKEAITYLRNLIWEARQSEEVAAKANLKSPETAAATA